MSVRCSLRGAWFVLCVMAACDSDSSGDDAAISDGDAASDAGAQGGATGGDCPPGTAPACPPPDHATWPMPNPSSLSLPHPTSYQVSGDTVVDQVTRLQWQRSAAGYVTFAAAQSHCAAMALGDRDDWRLPSRIELVSVIDFTRLPTIAEPAFTDTTGNDYFWSSTPAQAEGFAYSVYFGVGLTAYGVTSNASARVRCVRGGGPGASVRFVVAGETALDPNTGLRWQRGVSPVQLGWATAGEYCGDLELAGSDAWRVPSAKEIQTIVQEERPGPVVDEAIFPGTPNTRFWTSSASNRSNTSPAIYFDMNDGTTEEADQGQSYWVRCVTLAGP